MGTVLNSFDNILASAYTNGVYTRFFSVNDTTTTTAATTASGYTSCRRFASSLTFPSVGTGLTGGIITCFKMVTSSTNNWFAGIEYTLGTLTVSGNSFSAGVSMPTKIVNQQSYTTASEILVVHVDTALTATTPVLTITYTDQDGNGSQTATLTLPTSPAVRTVFFVDPHLAAGDTGARSVSNISISTGSSGVLSVRGLLIVGEGIGFTNFVGYSPRLSMPQILWPVAASEVVGIYSSGVTAACQLAGYFSAVADN